MAPMKNFTPRVTAVLALACGALVLTGCQASGPGFDRTLDVTPVPTASAPASETTTAPTAGLDVHFGPATFGITCATDSAGDSSHGTAALMCSWKSGDR
jgi:hypothetical protein